MSVNSKYHYVFSIFAVAFMTTSSNQSQAQDLCSMNFAGSPQRQELSGNVIKVTFGSQKIRQSSNTSDSSRSSIEDISDSLISTRSDATRIRALKAGVTRNFISTIMTSLVSGSESHYKSLLKDFPEIQNLIEEAKNLSNLSAQQRQEIVVIQDRLDLMRDITKSGSFTNQLRLNGINPEANLEVGAQARSHLKEADYQLAESDRNFMRQLRSELEHPFIQGVDPSEVQKLLSFASTLHIQISRWSLDPHFMKSSEGKRALAHIRRLILRSYFENPRMIELKENLTLLTAKDLHLRLGRLLSLLDSEVVRIESLLAKNSESVLAEKIFRYIRLLGLYHNDPSHKKLLEVERQKLDQEIYFAETLTREDRDAQEALGIILSELNSNSTRPISNSTNIEK